MTRWNEILRHTSHRPYPLPAGRVFGTMCWHDLLFAHYRVDRDALRAVVPARLELDLWRGDAWIGVVPFSMTHVGLPGLNQLPWLSAFAELNVRTYVRYGGKSGVFFLSLDAANWAAVLAARAGFLLPYFWARMRCHRHGQEILYRSQRLVGPAARFEARYAPTGEPQRSAPGSFEHWLTERYCLYTVGSGGQPYRCDIHHEPWPLQSAEATIATLDMTAAQQLSLTGEPVLHFARRLDVLAWPLRRAEEAGEEPVVPPNV
jgi:uncharacterized protein